MRGLKSFVGRFMALMLGLGLLVGLMALPEPVRAGDLDITISQDALQRLFQAVMPYKFRTALVAGQEADITLSNPAVEMVPGQPGQVFVGLDFIAKVEFLGMAPISGRAKPQAKFQYDTKKGQLKITVADLAIKGIPVDRFIEPIYLPLTSNDPIQLQGRQIQIQVKNAQTQVTDAGLVLMLDYNFVPVAGAAPKKTK
jgi:hypothetical protein